MKPPVVRSGLCLLFILPLLALPAWCQPPAFTGHAGLVAPKADPVSETSLAFYGLTYPPLGALQAAISLSDRMATVLTAGYSYLGSSQGGVASAIFRGDLFRPDGDSWGLTALGFWMGGGAVSGGEGRGANFYGGGLVASSPVNKYRAHFTAALHTLPGKRYEGIAPSFIVAGERRTDAHSLFVEIVCAAPGYEEKAFTTFILLGGVQVHWEKAAIKFGTGIISFRDQQDTYPAPPLISVIVPL